MAAAQATEPGYALRAGCLLAVLVLAKTIVLVAVGDSIALSLWSPIAYFWQDVLAALVFLGGDVVLRRPRLAWIVYGVLAGYAAINVPVIAALSSPLTATMMRAAGGALTDSVAHYVTPANIVGLLLPLLVAIVLPVALRSRPIPASSRLRAVTLLLALAFVAAGPFAASRVDTKGLHRNAVGAIVATSLPRLSPAGGDEDWRASPFASGTTDDLSRYRGRAAGRNVVLIVLESTAARYLGIYGAETDPAPALTALSREGLVFERAYATYPESIKGLFATLCSRYPAFDTAPEIYANVACRSLAAELQSRGYRTALFHSGRFDYLGMRSVIDHRGFDRLADAGDIGGERQSSFGVDEDSAVNRMLEWIDEAAGRSPFFLTYLPIAGHHPYVVNRPGPFDAASDFSRYLGSVHEGDQAIGRLLQGLRDRGLDRETLFLIFGDHGEAFGQHAGNYAHTLFLYEENVRVPYVIAAPGLLTAAMRVARPISVIDTAPTVLDLLGLPIPSGYQGASALDGRRLMALFYTDYSLGLLGLVDGCWKYVYELDADRSTLYDVCSDPDERHDRAAGEPARVGAYRDRVQKWAAAQKQAIGR